MKRVKRAIYSTILCARFPFLKYYDREHKFFQNTCWYFAIDYGWRKIAMQMFEEIRYSLKRSKQPLTSFRIYDIKQKYGFLDIGCSGGLYDEVSKIVEKYEYISGLTCNVCGRPAYGYTKGWVMPYCRHCAPRNVPIYEYGTERSKWYDTYMLSKKGDEPVILPDYRSMINKKEVKEYIKHYRRLIKSGMHGAAGYVETGDNQYSDMEIAVRYLSQHNEPIKTNVETSNGKRKCYVTIEKRSS